MSDQVVLSRNPVTGLRILCDSSAHSIASKKLNLEPSALALSLVFRIVGDLAIEADAIARDEGWSVPSFQEAVSGIVPAPTTVVLQHGRRQTYLAMGDFSSIFEADTVMNLESHIDNYAKTPPISLEDHDSLRRHLEELVHYLREDRPAEVAAEADLVADDLELGVLEIMRASSRVEHCLLTSSSASLVNGDLLAYALKWGREGHREVAQKSGEFIASLAGMFVPGVGVIGVLSSGKSLLHAVDEAYLGPKELTGGSGLQTIEAPDEEQ